MAVTFESATRLTALKNKIDGVTAVESLTLSDAVNNALAGYGQGGEQSLGYATGTFIPESNTKMVDITHNLGRIPSFIFVYYTGTYSLTSTFSNSVICVLFAVIGKQLMLRSWNQQYMMREYNLTSFENMSDEPIREATETTVRLYNGVQDDFYAQGYEYKWIMW